MPDVLVIDAWNCEVGGQEPWPDDVKLYQPYETEQILLPENSSCLSVQAFLKMCNLNFSIEYRANAEQMSPSGRVPFIRCGAFLVAELDPVVRFVGNKGISLSSDLDGSQKSDMRAYMSLVNTVLGNAEAYVTWVDPVTYSQVSKPRYGSVHPFPLNHILAYTKRQSVIKKLSALGWYNKTIDQVYDEVDQCCQALSERLEKQPYFFGDKPCEVDAACFGHIYGILTYPSYPTGLRLAEILRSYEPIMSHCRRLMPQVHLSENIDEPRLHISYLKESTQSEDPKRKEEEVYDEFVFFDDSEMILNDLSSGEDSSLDVVSPSNGENKIYQEINVFSNSATLASC